MNFLSQFRGLLFMMVVATACTSGAYSAEEPTSDYVLPSGAIQPGRAPGMKVQLIRDGDTKEYAVTKHFPV